MAKANRYVVCIQNRGHAAALELRKIYRIVDDESADDRGLLRVIDESGEDYLYPAAYFASIVIPPEVVKSFSEMTA